MGSVFLSDLVCVWVGNSCSRYLLFYFNSSIGLSVTFSVFFIINYTVLLQSDI